MARPQLKDDFLEDALKIAREGTIIHFYDFLKEEEMPEKALEKITRAVDKSKKKLRWIDSWKIIRWKKALEIGPRKWRVRVDFYVF
jgi:tRNA G37 N-methylase Trm5